VLDLHFPRHQQNQQLQEHRRLLLHHFVDCRATAPAKGGMHLPDGVGVEGVTRALGIPTEVSSGSYPSPANQTLAGTVRGANSLRDDVAKLNKLA
jgi:hypothetical protein